jgi:hypothetical protein
MTLSQPPVQRFQSDAHKLTLSLEQHTGSMKGPGEMKKDHAERKSPKARHTKHESIVMVSSAGVKFKIKVSLLTSKS